MKKGKEEGKRNNGNCYQAQPVPVEDVQDQTGAEMGGPRNLEVPPWGELARGRGKETERRFPQSLLAFHIL